MAQVLVIDDDPLFATLVKHRLAAAGHQVAYNEGPFGALTVARRGGYELILIDVQMPDIEGPQLVDCFRSRGTPGLRIILMSSLPEQEVVGLAEKSGADAAFCKTSGLDKLEGIVKSVLQS